MFILVPLAHEDAEARRWPVVTSVIIALNVLVWCVTFFAERAATPRIVELAEQVEEYAESRPYLRRPAEIGGIPLGATPSWGPSSRAPAPDDEDALQAEQQELDAKVSELEAALDDLPHRRFGFVPKRMNLLGLVTSQFLHAGVLHLLFNMWFMWLCACNLEDRWGRVVFPCFFLIAGVVAALSQAAFAPDSPVPMVGASGAVAGAMGAFLVTHARTRVTLFYLFMIFFRPRWGTFRAPAFVVLALWLGGELLSAAITPAGQPGVAHWAHIGGFAFGAVAAVVFRVTGIDRRLDDASEKASVLVAQDPRVLEAAECTDRGDAARAIPVLEAVLRDRPRDLDAHLELLRASKAAGDAPRERRTYGRLVALYASQGMMDAAADMALEARSFGLADAVPPEVCLRVAAAAAASGATQRATQLYAIVLGRGVVDAASAHAAVATAELANARGGRMEARSLASEVLGSPYADPAVRARAERIVRDLGPEALDV